MEGLVRDFLYAVRVTRRQMAVSLVAIVTLTVGIGASVAIFSLLHAIILEPLAYPDSEQIITLWQDQRRVDGPIDEWASWDNFHDWREDAHSVASMAAVGGFAPTFTSTAGESEQLQGALGSADIFQVLGVTPALGQGFDATHDTANAERVVVVSHEFWRRRLGADPAVVGTTITLNAQAHRILGIMPEAAEYPFVTAPDVIRPLSIDASNSCGRACVTLRVVGRLREQTTIDQAASELTTIAQRLEQLYPDANTGVGIYVVSLHSRVTGRAKAPLTVLLLAVNLLLLIACANVANLQLARASGRKAEMSLRLSIGASRRRLVRQLLIESLWLSALGGAGGIALAMLMVNLFRSSFGGVVPRLDEVVVSLPVLLFALGLTLVTGLLFGIAPALRASGYRLVGSLKQAGTAPGGRRFRSGLVVAEVGVAIILLIGASLLTRSLAEIVRQDLGYQPQGVVLSRVTLPPIEYEEPARRRDFTQRVLERLRAQDYVLAASHTMSPPLAAQDGDTNFRIEGAPPPTPSSQPVAWFRTIDYDYFRTMQIPLRQGRALSATDDENTAQVVVINEALANRYWPKGDAIGSRVSFNNPPRWREVVGIVGDTRHFGLTSPARPAAYFPYRQSPVGAVNFTVRTTGSPDVVSPLLRQIVAEIDPNLAIGTTQTLDAVVSQSRRLEQFVAFLLTLFSLTALSLAGIGLYGVLSYSVAQRTKELGIRVALGADERGVRRLVLFEGLSLAVVGLVLGLGVASLSARALASLLFQVSPYDFWTFTLAPALLLTVAFVACLLPALRACRLNVIETLRAE